MDVQVAVSTLLWCAASAASNIFTKTFLNERSMITPGEIAFALLFAQFFVALVVAMAWCSISRSFPSRIVISEPKLWLCGLFNLCGALLTNGALFFGSVAFVGAVKATGPFCLIFTQCVRRQALPERSDVFALVCISIAAGGLLWNGGGASLESLLLVIGSNFSFAWRNALTKEFFSDGVLTTAQLFFFINLVPLFFTLLGGFVVFPLSSLFPAVSASVFGVLFAASCCHCVYHLASLVVISCVSVVAHAALSILKRIIVISCALFWFPEKLTLFSATCFILVATASMLYFQQPWPEHRRAVLTANILLALFILVAAADGSSTARLPVSSNSDIGFAVSDTVRTHTAASANTGSVNSSSRLPQAQSVESNGAADRAAVFSSGGDAAYAVLAMVSLWTVKRKHPEMDAFFFCTNAFADATVLHIARRLNVTLVFDDRVRKDFQCDSAKTEAIRKRYPVEVFFVFYGPEVLRKQGYTRVLYIDGDAHLNKAIPEQLWTGITTIGAANKKGKTIWNDFGSLRSDIGSMKRHWSLVKNYDRLPRAIAGVTFFNSTWASEYGLYERIVTLFSESCRLKIPRLGDDSLFECARLTAVIPSVNLLSEFYNAGTYPAPLDDWVRNVVFYQHAPGAIRKPWHSKLSLFNSAALPNKGRSLISSSAKKIDMFFIRRWQERAMEVLSLDELETYVPSLYHPSLRKAKWTPSQTPFYWYSSTPNFGDFVTPYLVSKTCNFQPINVDPTRHSAAIVSLSTGSLFTRVRSNTIVFGTGIQRQGEGAQPARFVRFVRGPLMREHLTSIGQSFCPALYGDPALLLPLYFPAKVSYEFEVAVIPHAVEFTRVSAMYSNDRRVLIVDVRTNNPEDVIKQIVRAKRTISSSLHGIIVSHAYGVPSRWVKFSNKLAGDGSLKFKDYFSSVGLKNETFLDARTFALIPFETLVSFVGDHPPPVYDRIDTSLLRDAMFCDDNTQELRPFVRFAHLLKAPVL